MAEPDLSAELDDAERIVNGEVAEVRTEWGVRWTDEMGQHTDSLSAAHGDRAEAMARALIKPHRQRLGDPVTVVKRKVIVGEWEDAE